jgi:threonine dehydrogenase-like Zn-dependent dehydrogenase
VYGREVDQMPLMEMFDRGVQLRMGQAHVRRWTDEILPLLLDPADPLGTLDLATHQLPLADATHGYEIFRAKKDGFIKVVLAP